MNAVSKQMTLTNISEPKITSMTRFLLILERRLKIVLKRIFKRLKIDILLRDIRKEKASKYEIAQLANEKKYMHRQFYKCVSCEHSHIFK